MTKLVVDASVALSWCLAEEENAYARRILAVLEYQAMVVPAIWRLEMANVLGFTLQQNRIGRREIEDALRLLGGLTILEMGMSWQDCLRDLVPLAQETRLTVYDASYLDLALRLKIPLATLDQKLEQAARLAGVAIAGEA